ncbi:MAG: TetR/AcrR family transcriptional regulator [Eubacteriales bacterium]|nr:TetR/AcrR family transcriptional regulator [Eubacteriales bacterium]
MKTVGFEKAPPEKQLSVINAGFRCFGKDGFQKTAMSEIAQAAGVSKAALFHYFGTKAELYDFLFRFACDEISRKIPVGTEDFMECISIGTKVKFEVMARYPGMYDFLVAVMQDESGEAETLRRNANTRAIEEGSMTLFAKVDWSKFRPNVSPADAMNLVTWVSMGCLKGNLEKSQGEILSEVERYLDLIKKAIYKENIV